MKKFIASIAIAIISAFALTSSVVNAEEYGENDFSGETAVAQAEDTANQEIQENSDDEDAAFAKCCFYRSYRSYYTPVYYYRPVVYRPVYYYTVSYRYYYSPVVYYAAACYKSAATRGIKMNANPPAGSPLALQGIEAGDVITAVDGHAIRSASQLDGITVNNKLTVLKNNK